MVGRNAPLAAADAAIAAATCGAGGLLLICGEPGIGKSRLVQAIADRAGSRGVAQAWGYAVDDPGAPALWPWRRALRCWPEVAALVGTGADARAREDTSAAARFQLFTDICDQLVQRAAPTGLLLILEDMHWADHSSVLLLQQLAGDLDRSAVLAVVTYRPHQGALTDALNQLVRGPSVTHVALAGLTGSDIEAWLRGYPVIADRVALAQSLHRRTGGNPLLVRLVTQALLSSDSAEGPAAVDRLLTQRADLRRLIAARTAALSPTTNKILSAASVLGERIDMAVLAAVTGSPGPELARSLDDAVAAGVLRGALDAAEDYVFVHALVRDAIYADLQPSLRAEWHRRCALALASADQDAADHRTAVVGAAGRDTAGAGPAAGVIAEHWRRAVGPEALTHCLYWARRASRDAGAAIAHDDAVRFADLAVRCARELAVPESELAELTVQLAEAQFMAGRVEASLDTCVLATDLAQAAGRPELMAAAGLVVQGIGTTPVNRRVRGLCQRALGLLGSEPTVLRARLLAQIAATTAEDEGGALAQQLSAEALTAAEATGDPVASLEAIAARHLSISVPDMVIERLDLGRRAVQLGTTAQRPIGPLWGHLWRADAAYQLGNLAEVDREVAEIDRIATSRRSPLARWHHHRLLACRTALTGDFAGARRANDAARELAERMGDLSLAGMSHAFSAQLALVRGDTAELPSDFRDMLRTAPDMPLVGVSGTIATALEGDLSGAQASFDRYRDLPRTFPVGTRWAGTIAQIGMAAILLDDAEVAGTVYRLLSPTALYYTGDGSGALFNHGSNSGLIGALALTSGRVDDAVRHFTDAIAMNIKIDARPFTALARLGLARALLARVDSGPGSGSPGGRADAVRARGLLEQSAAEFGRLDMPGPLRTASSALTRLSEAERTGNPLSPRESEIAALVSQSLSNRAIAERLFVSERTVETHVRSILSKLGFASRTEIVSWELQRRG